jgi:hypothetical protein
VRFDWLQVPDDMLRVRSVTLAQLLTEAVGKRVSHGDALLVVLKTWLWVVSQVREDESDLSAEFARCSVLPRVKAEKVLPGAVDWAPKHGEALVSALLDPHVRVLTEDGDAVRVVDVEQRYTRLAKKQSESRGRARASQLAREHGWKVAEGGGWMNPANGETVDSWRDLLTRLEAKP